MIWADLVFVGPAWAAGFVWRGGHLFSFRQLPDGAIGGVCVYTRPVRIVYVGERGLP